jgi:hypothetical protein
MPTEKHRISISPDDKLHTALGALARKRKQPVSAVVLALVEKALELEEDIHWSRVADERLEKDKGKRSVGHADAWK